jgi:hypothetical protein
MLALVDRNGGREAAAEILRKNMSVAERRGYGIPLIKFGLMDGEVEPRPEVCAASPEK